MIVSQRPMMLAGAVGLAKLVQEESAVTWSDEENVEAYIEKLRVAVDRLSRENNQLAAYHRQMQEKVDELIETDLIRYQHKWKDNVNQMRELLSQVSSQVCQNPQNTVVSLVSLFGSFSNISSRAVGLACVDPY